MVVRTNINGRGRITTWKGGQSLTTVHVIRWADLLLLSRELRFLNLKLSNSPRIQGPYLISCYSHGPEQLWSTTRATKLRV